MSLQIMAVKRRIGFQQASIKKFVPQRVLPSRALMEQKEPKSSSIPVSPVYNLFTWLHKAEQACAWVT